MWYSYFSLIVSPQACDQFSRVISPQRTGIVCRQNVTAAATASCSMMWGTPWCLTCQGRWWKAAACWWSSRHLPSLYFQVFLKKIRSSLLILVSFSGMCRDASSYPYPGSRGWRAGGILPGCGCVSLHGRERSGGHGFLVSLPYWLQGNVIVDIQANDKWSG